MPNFQIVFNLHLRNMLANSLIGYNTIVNYKLNNLDDCARQVKNEKIIRLVCN